MNGVDRNAADKEAQRQSLQGLPRQVHSERTDTPAEESRGGSTGYRVSKRLQAIEDACLYGVLLSLHVITRSPRVLSIVGWTNHCRTVKLVVGRAP